MSSHSEVGHAKNVANLQKITQQVNTYSLYNPPVENISLASLQTLYNNANAKLNEVADKRQANKNAIVARQSAFENLKSTCTSIMNLLEILGLPQGTLDQARSLNRAMQGSSKKTTTPPEEGKEAPRTVSTSRQSYTQQTENFGLLVQLLGTIPNYAPNEADLKLNNLNTYHSSLLSATLVIDQTESELNTRMIERDKMLYAEGTGLYTIAQNVKKYVKSLYGATSPEYTNVSAIKFSEK
ncbi:hypothetical protein PGH12_18005 [Chryseobacterium wangxinyae]|uniref:hypothetical protein n=1 Tax=Chryseobacterium sp. CY350 TaxID=2997336 RepID=UPI0022701207|nr:hypothetical protein [Chryseobacterium sp. CY350]MCY0977653.1 hypothetical protein [Chryseobacterium sp. CY350]WBZ95338.1 hypothetical protein PGH12_18005 [Chryseobacterium sp. CY350]